MLAGILDALEQIVARQARVLVLRAEGPDFCAGRDIREAGPSGPGIVAVCEALRDLPVPSLALVQGRCIGSGVALVCCCDIVLATGGAAFSIPELRLGMVPAPLLPFFRLGLPDRLLKSLLLRGASLSAVEAERCGLVSECVEWEGAALQRVIDELRLSAPRATAQTKAALSCLPELGGDELQAIFDRQAASPEFAEGRQAMAEKRRPVWAGPGKS